MKKGEKGHKEEFEGKSGKWESEVVDDDPDNYKMNFTKRT